MLLENYKTHKETVLKWKLIQCIHACGDGVLKDNSKCSDEFRQFLNIIDFSHLKKLATECVNSKDKDLKDIKGFILQDIVNELGKRLDYKVETGLYRGIRGSIGHDGLWTCEDRKNDDIIAEVKTSIAHQIDLDPTNKYRNQLIEEKKINSKSSILYIIGKGETKQLEEQIRGRRSTPDEMRIISLHSLLQLVEIKQEKSSDLDIIFQIRNLFKPIQYTKIDRLIDILYNTADAVAETESEIETEDSSKKISKRTNSEILEEKRKQTINAFSNYKKINLIKKTRATYTNENEEFRVCIGVSKKYERPYQRYWYAYLSNYDSFLKDGKESYYIVSCINHDFSYAIPRKIMEENLKNMNITDRENKKYWHVSLIEETDGLYMSLPKIKNKISLDEYKFDDKAKND